MQGSGETGATSCSPPQRVVAGCTARGCAAPAWACSRTATGSVVHLSHQLTAGGANFVATRSAYGHGITRILQHAAEGADCRIAGALVIGAIERIERDQIDLAWQRAQQVGQFTRMLAM